jgi:hypothetical protein
MASCWTIFDKTILRNTVLDLWYTARLRRSKINGLTRVFEKKEVAERELFTAFSSKASDFESRLHFWERLEEGEWRITGAFFSFFYFFPFFGGVSFFSSLNLWYFISF